MIVSFRPKATGRAQKKGTLLAIIQRESLTDRVHALLRDRIVEGSLPTGAKLPSIENLAAELGVSRTVAREAVAALAAQGLLDVVHGQGTMVAAGNSSSVADALRYSMRNNIDLHAIMEVRIALEVEAAALAAQRHTDADIANLERDVADMALARFDAAAFLEADLAFHGHIIEATHNGVFELVTQPVAQLLRETRLAVMRDVPSTRDDRGVRTHESILRKIARRDATGAACAMRTHLEHVNAHIARAVTHQPHDNRSSRVDGRLDGTEAQ